MLPQGNVISAGNTAFQRDRSASTNASPISSTGSAEYPISLKSKAPVGVKLAGNAGGVEGDKWNRCKYQCCLCDLITLDHRQMRIHIATQHSLQYDEYCRQYGGTEIVSKRFHCDLCNSEMKFCRQNASHKAFEPCGLHFDLRRTPHPVFFTDPFRLILPKIYVRKTKVFNISILTQIVLAD